MLRQQQHQQQKQKPQIASLDLQKSLTTTSNYRRFHRRKDTSISYYNTYSNIFIIILLVLLFNVPSSESVKCYCTDDHCVPYGACDGTVCLVGILRENNQIIRTCGSHPLGCHRDEDDKWTDLCACDQPLCNTFSYLRAHTSQQRQETHFAPDPDEVPLVFNRMDRKDDEPAPPLAPISTRTSLLTLLLVVVPLTVGGATIMVVAFNYYCHLC